MKDCKKDYLTDHGKLKHKDDTNGVNFGWSIDMTKMTRCNYNFTTGE